MKTYQYKILRDSEIETFGLDDINNLGAEGWRVVTYIYSDYNYDTVIMEKEIIK